MVRNHYRHERVRHFQPPWRTVLVITCGKCKHESRVRVNWTGVAPAGGFRCAGNCGETIPFRAEETK